MEEYPRVKIPYEMDKIKNLIPEVPKIPEPPTPPVRKNYPSPPEKILPEEPKLNIESSGCFNYPLIIGIVILLACLGAEDSEEYIGYILFSIAIIIISVLVINNANNEKDRKREEFRMKQIEYPKKLKKIEMDYENKLEWYYSERERIDDEYDNKINFYQTVILPSFHEEKKEIKKKIEQYQDINYITEYRKEELRNFLKTITAPSIHPTQNEIKKGVSEDGFAKKLKKKFANKIYQNYTIINSESENYFLPDFTLFDHVNNLCIDIEIDEPYIGKNGRPIHFSSNSHDYERDLFFLRNGWIVIRFAEKQIIENPDACINLISETIYNSTLGEINYGFDPQIHLPKIAQWTKDEAHEMAFRRERNKYLGKELIEKLDSEEQENGDFFEELKYNVEQKKEKVLEEKKSKENLTDHIDIPTRNDYESFTDYDDDLPF